MKLAVIGLFLVYVESAAHPVSLSWARGSIEDDKITLSFKILAEDLVLFHKLEHNGNFDFSVDKLRTATTDHSDVVLNYFYVEEEQGHRLSTNLLHIDDSELTSEWINVMDLMKHAIIYQLEIELPHSEWELLTFYQEFSSHRKGVPAVTFLTLFKEGKAMLRDQEVSPGNPFLITPTGSGPTREPSRLSSSYFSMTEAGITHELTIPAETLQRLMYSPQIPSFQETIHKYFSSYNPIWINDTRVTPELVHLNVLTHSNEEAKLEGLVYINLFYPIEEPLFSSRLTWEEYTWKFRWLQSIILAPDGTYKHTFSRYQPRFVWKRQMNVSTD